MISNENVRNCLKTSLIVENIWSGCVCRCMWMYVSMFYFCSATCVTTMVIVHSGYHFMMGKMDMFMIDCEWFWHVRWNDWSYGSCELFLVNVWLNSIIPKDGPSIANEKCRNSKRFQMTINEHVQYKLGN